MHINSLRDNLSTITDIVFFCGGPFLTSVVFLTLHGTLLTTRGRRGFTVLVFFVCFFLFAMVSNAVDTHVIFLRSAPTVKVVRISNTRGGQRQD